MLLNILQTNLPWTYKIGLILLILPGILIALIVHEVAHGWVAWKRGDPTAKNLGRLSLNPLHHLDPVGTVMLLLIGFGWAKPVPVNTRNFKKPRVDMALTALAGPLSNFVLALIGALLWGLVIKVTPVEAAADMNVWTVLQLGLSYFMSINIGLGLFNLIPIPPLDGSNILACMLPPNAAAKYLNLRRYTQYIYYGLILLSILGNRIALFGQIENVIWYPLMTLRELMMNGLISLAALIFGIPL